MKCYDFDTLRKNGNLKSVPCVLAIGVFDGVHYGHKDIFSTLASYTNTHPGTQSMVITFDRNPKGQKMARLDTMRLRKRYSSSFGINSFVVIDFSMEFSKIPASGFLSMLLQLCDVKAVVVGEDFKCGYPEAQAKAIELRDMFLHLGRTVDVIIRPFVRNEEGLRISSTLLREMISQGRMDLMAHFAGRPYEVDLVPLPSKNTPDGLLYPLEAIMQVLPPPGLYKARMLFSNKQETRCQAVISQEFLLIRGVDSSTLSGAEWLTGADEEPDSLLLLSKEQT